MPPFPPSDVPTGLLADLRARSLASRARSGQAVREQHRRGVEECLWRAFHWLDEATHHLELLQPQVRHSFRIPGVLAIDGPRYERGFITYRRRAIEGMELIEQLELVYRLSHLRPVELAVEPAKQAHIEQALRAAHLAFRAETVLDDARAVRHVAFTITPAITAGVRFEPEYQRDTIHVELRNVEGFGSTKLDLAPGALNEAALEDLVRLMLGEGRGFLARQRQPVASGRSLGTMSSA